MEIIKLEHLSQKTYTIASHSHDCWEILLQLSGSAEIYFSDCCMNFYPGSICIIPPHTVHNIVSQAGFCKYSLLTRDFRPFGQSRVFLLQDDSKGSVAQLLDLIERFYSEYKYASINIAVAHTLGDALYHMLASFYAQNDQHDFRIERIIDIMYENIPNSSFNFNDFLQSSGYSHGHLRKLFKKMTGKSPVQYFQQIRIEYAKSLIQQYGDSKPIKEIAAECGFEDPLYFSRTFHKIENISPQEYRKMLYAEHLP